MPIRLASAQCALGAAIIALCWRATSLADSVDDLVRSQMRLHHVPGLSLAVIQAGKVVRIQAYGVMQCDSSRPVTPDTLFEAASISKSVAAVGALRLVDRGRLSLDTDVNTELTEWKVPDNPFTKREKVTLRRILNHSAGLSTYGVGDYEPGHPLPTLLQMLDGEKPALTQPVRVIAVPGSQFGYSGGGYMILQLMLEEAAGEPFSEFMEKSVLKPAGMDRSYFAQPPSGPRTSSMALGHDFLGRRMAVPWYVIPAEAGGGLWTTAADLARFTVALQNCFSKTPGALLSAKVAAEMEADRLGIFTSGAGRARRFGNKGQELGFESEFTAYFETGQGAVVMINANDHSRIISRVMDAIAARYAWYGYERQVPPLGDSPALVDRNPTATLLVRRLFDEIGERGECDPGILTAECAARFWSPAHQRKEEIRSWGRMKTIELIGPKPARPLNYLYRVNFDKYEVLVYCVLNRAGVIEDLYFTYV